jgi:hypothetical protein
MMSNIKELYKLAGVNKTNVTCDYCELKCYDCTKTPCPVDYPPFTAEKQLELIKWLTTTYRVLTLERTFCNNFDQALAGLILELWDELSSEQREEVKEILG